MASNGWNESRFDCCAISACASMILHTFVFIYNFCDFVEKYLFYRPLILMLKPASLKPTDRLGDMMSLLELFFFPVCGCNVEFGWSQAPYFHLHNHAKINNYYWRSLLRKLDTVRRFKSLQSYYLTLLWPLSD